MNKQKEVIPNTLKENRLKVGITQKQVAEKIGVNSQERISHWEAGRNIPNLANLVKLCKLYKVNVNLIYPDLY